jgi:pimeloyl-[acyl-carrier protein] methyl ester esterase
MLRAEVAGLGPDLVLVHGWGMHSGVWQEWARRLGGSFRVTAIDLPGHGDSGWTGQPQLEAWAAQVLQAAPRRAWWVGWSLGGLVALAAASRAPERLRAVVLLAATPRFVVSPDWTSAVRAGVFRQFVRQLTQDADRTLSRFLALQVRGTEGGNETLRRLRSALNRRPGAEEAALRIGLEFLEHTDLRKAMQLPGVPVYWLLGERDPLIPARVRDAFPELTSAVIRGAGHAPFLSHPEPCTRQLHRWLLQDEEGSQNAAG